MTLRCSANVGYVIPSRSCDSGRHCRQTDPPQGKVTGVRNGLEQRLHCTNLTNALASSCASSRATSLPLFSVDPPSWFINASGSEACVLKCFATVFCAFLAGRAVFELMCGFAASRKRGPFVPTQLSDRRHFVPRCLSPDTVPVASWLKSLLLPLVLVPPMTLCPRSTRISGERRCDWYVALE